MVETTAAGMPPVEIAEGLDFLVVPEELRGALSYLAYKTGRPVYAKWYLERIRYSDCAVHIYFYTHRSRARHVMQKPVRIRGQEVTPGETRTLAQVLTYGGDRVVDDNHTPLALVDHNCLTVVADLSSFAPDKTPSVLSYIVENALPLLDFRVAELLAEEQKKLRRRLSEWWTLRTEVSLAEHREELNGIRGDLERARRTILAGEQRRPTLLAEIEALERFSSKPPQARIAKQHEGLTGLMDSCLYEGIDCEPSGRILATTCPITISYDDWLFELGAYEVKINPDGEVVIRALSEHPGATHPHPHVSTNGAPCLGNIDGDVAQLIGAWQIAEALGLLHQFLCSYSPDNPYEKIGAFDPTGEYVDENEDPCEDCDIRCSPDCICSCDHNEDRFGCGDCHYFRY